MYRFKSNSFVNPEMSKYLKEQTNKCIEKHLNNYNTLRVSSLVKCKNIEPKLPGFCFGLAFVSLISFLAGYNFRNIIENPH